MRPALKSLAIGVAAVVGAALSGSAQPMEGTRIIPARQAHGEWTVVTLARDGSWGAATELSVGHALAKAIRDCKAMSGAELGCGAHFRAIQAGWILAIRCGDRNILTAESLLADAEHAARRREIDLKRFYLAGFPACSRVLTVDPHGSVAVTTLQHVPAVTD